MDNEARSDTHTFVTYLILFNDRARSVFLWIAPCLMSYIRIAIISSIVPMLAKPVLRDTLLYIPVRNKRRFLERIFFLMRVEYRAAS